MAKEELKSVNQQQRLVNRSPEQLKRNTIGQKHRQIHSENIDTVAQSPKKWSIAGIALAGVLLASAAGVGSWKMLNKNQVAPQAAPNAAVNNNNSVNTPAAVSPKQEQQGQMLLGQAKLLAQQGQPQQLAQAIAITQRVPAGVTVAAEAKSLSATWGGQILENANAEATAGKVPEAIAIASLVPANSQTHAQAQQQIQQWQQQQAQAQQQQFAAKLAEESRPVPLPPPVSVPSPAPVTTTPVTTNTAPTPSVAPQPAVEPQAQPQPAVQSNSSSQLQAAQVKKPDNPGKQAQSLANDPYLNVQIPQATVPQAQSKAISSSPVAITSNGSFTNNSYGFNNMVTKASTVAIRLRDNVDEDGDFVSLIVNGEVIVNNQMINNYGRVVMVDLLPGENKIEIEGVKDGQGGITLEANVAGEGNINNRPIPEGSTASFIINREQ